jgi:hypothetical protein
LTVFSSELKKATLRILKHPRKEVISMKKTIIIGLSLVLGLALIATVALAWGPGFGPGFGRGYGLWSSHDGNKEPLVISELGPKNFSGPPL